MNGVDYLQVFHALGAETVLVVTALAALTADLAGLRHAARARRAQLLGAIAMTGLLAATLPLLRQFGAPGQALLHGTLVMDPFAALFKILIVLLTAVTVLISMDHDIGRHMGEYYAVMLFGAIGMMLLVSAAELIMIFVALELTSIALYILTAFHKASLRSQEAALKYFMFGAISSAFLLFGLSYIYGLSGETSLAAIGVALRQLDETPLLGVGLLFVLIGLGFKIAVVPFHLWAPDAYEGAPTPVTAFIATGSKVASFVVLTRMMMVGFEAAAGSALLGNFAQGWTLLLALAAAASMLLGNLVAIVQRNVKRLLAYSSIAHAGYILVGLVAATTMGAASVMFYIIVYGLTNLGAFGVVAALAGRAGGDDLVNFNGMARRAPYLSLLLLIFMLSLAGIPPLGGFFGKFYLFAAAVQRDAETFGLMWLVILGILTSTVSLYYYLIVLKHCYVIEPDESGRIQTPWPLNIGLGIVALAVIGLGVYPEPVLALLTDLLAAW
jgi:NADH-quinone oxidoreductase subunit N